MESIPVMPFIHHVYFWLKHPSSAADREELIEGLKKLSGATTIHWCHIGQPATTRREVVDRSYSISWLIFFENKAQQDQYQTDPIHLKFIKECSHLWERVVVYDTVSAR